jgi:hypothetical protein
MHRRIKITICGEERASFLKVLKEKEIKVVGCTFSFFKKVSR